MAHDAHAKNHPYHLVDPSPWPFFGSMAALWLAVMALLYMHPEMLGPASRPRCRSSAPGKSSPGCCPC